MRNHDVSVTDDQGRLDLLSKLVALFGRLKTSGRLPKQASLAAAAGVSQGKISRFCRGETSLRADELAGILEIYGIDLADVLDHALFDSIDDLPECVKRFLGSAIVQHKIKPDERDAIIALARCGVFDRRTASDVEETWALILIDSGRA